MSDETQFLNLPSHLINDILSRLSTRTIVQCKCVCKTWLKLLSESEFINLHLSRSPPCLIVQRLDIYPSDSSCFSLVEFEDEPDHHDYRCVAGHEIKPPKLYAEERLSLDEFKDAAKRLSLVESPDIHDFRYAVGHEISPQKMCLKTRLSLTMVSSINGLICLNGVQHEHDEVCLWNPSTREFIKLPKPRGPRSDQNIVRYGFGLSSQSGQYKVVRIFQVLETNTRRILESNCDVCTLGEGNQGLGLWRIIEHAPFVDSFRAHGVFLNANLHWLINDRDSSESISRFDLEEESFLPFPAPPELGKNFDLVGLGVFGGCLSLCDNTSADKIVIWVMKVYGITTSWSKEIVIDKKLEDFLPFPSHIVRVLKVFKDGNILLLLGDDMVLSYDCRRKTLRDYYVHRLINELDDESDEEGYAVKSNPWIGAIEYVSSFLSLKNFGIEKVESIDEKKVDVGSISKLTIS